MSSVETPFVVIQLSVFRLGGFAVDGVFFWVGHQCNNHEQSSYVALSVDTRTVDVQLSDPRNESIRLLTQLDPVGFALTTIPSPDIKTTDRS